MSIASGIQLVIFAACLVVGAMALMNYRAAHAADEQILPGCLGVVVAIVFIINALVFAWRVR